MQQNRAAAACPSGSKGELGAGEKLPPPNEKARPRSRTGSKPVQPRPRREGATNNPTGSALPLSLASGSLFVPDAASNGSASSIVQPPAVLRTPPSQVRVVCGSAAGAAGARRLYSPPGVSGAVPPASQLILELGG